MIDKLDGRALNIYLQDSSVSSLFSAAKEVNSLQEHQEQKTKWQVLLENVKKEIVYHAQKYSNKEQRRWAWKKCPQFSFKIETVRD